MHFEAFDAVFSQQRHKRRVFYDALRFASGRAPLMGKHNKATEVEMSDAFRYEAPTRSG